MKNIDKNKLEQLELHTGIHTLAITSEFIEPPKFYGVQVLTNYVDRVTKEMKTLLKINPNNYYFGKDKYINTLKEFREVMRDIKNKCRCINSHITRIDFRIDNYADTYDDFYKMNKIIVLLLCDTLDITNIWDCKHPIYSHAKSIRGQNADFEIEYYNRWDKTQTQGLTTARLELRNKNIECQVKDIPELINKWRDMLLSLPEQYERLQEICNNQLLTEWQTVADTITMRSFIYKNHDRIFSMRQLKELLELMGADNPQHLAYKYKNSENIELISGNELKTYIRNANKSLMCFRGKYKKVLK